MQAKHVYDYEVDIDSDTAPARVIRLVGHGRKVLEVGAGPGSITRVLTRRGNHVTALEVDDSALDILRPYCERAIKADLNDPSWPSLLEGERFDVVVAADVLEHVYSPWTVLEGMRSLLNAQGSIVLSIPHVGHNALQACLFDEDFEYRDWGLLDRTHIRFFGMKNMQKLLHGAGLKPIEVEFVVRSPEETEFADRWRSMPADLQAALKRNKFGNVYQVVSKSIPTERDGLAIDLMSTISGPSDLPARTIDRPAKRLLRSVRARVRDSMGPDTRKRVHLLASRLGVRL